MVDLPKHTGQRVSASKSDRLIAISLHVCMHSKPRSANADMQDANMLISSSETNVRVTLILSKALLSMCPTHCWHAASEMRELGMLQSPLPFGGSQSFAQPRQANTPNHYTQASSQADQGFAGLFGSYDSSND